jgi:hypothetical protein
MVYILIKARVCGYGDGVDVMLAKGNVGSGRIPKGKHIVIKKL